jgi:hypothetical protein
MPFNGEVRDRGLIQDGKHDGPWVFLPQRPEGIEGPSKQAKQKGVWTFFNPDGIKVPERSGIHHGGALVD